MALNMTPFGKPIGRVGSWAPGSYQCKCIVCDGAFTGDKRSLHCLTCAIDALRQPRSSTIPEETVEAMAAAFVNSASELIDDNSENPWGAGSPDQQRIIKEAMKAALSVLQAREGGV